MTLLFNPKHLLVGTHGRSIYKADISKLQQLTPDILGKPLHIFALKDIKYDPDWGNAPGPWSKPTTPGLDIYFYTSGPEHLSATIQTLDGIVVSTTDIDTDAGFNILSYDVAFSKTGKTSYLKKNKKELFEAENGKTYLPKGKYRVEISGNGPKAVSEFEIKTP